MVNSTPRYFCIGSNKTGTTSLTLLLAELQFHAMPEEIAYRFVDTSDSLVEAKKKVARLVRSYYSVYPFFEDLPICYRSAYKIICQNVPNSKFILTTREPQSWFGSCLNWIQSKQCQEIYNWIWGEEFLPKNKSKILGKYNRRNREVVKYFRDIGRSSDLLVLPVERAKVSAVALFLGFSPSQSNYLDTIMAYPCANKSSYESASASSALLSYGVS